MKYLLFTFLLLLADISHAQKVTLSFQPSLKEVKAEIETLQFYISNIQLQHNNQPIFKEENSYHLIDLEDTSSLEIVLDVSDSIQFSVLTFSLGIDSLTNVSGAFGGDLDPTNGMYWTWQSGYINFKLEGLAPECPARQHRFQFHIGGYQAPYNSLQQISFPIYNQRTIDIQLSLHQLFNRIDLKEQYQIMGPSIKAVEFSKVLKTLFSISS